MKKKKLENGLVSEHLTVLYGVWNQSLGLNRIFNTTVCQLEVLNIFLFGLRMDPAKKKTTNVTLMTI